MRYHQLGKIPPKRHTVFQDDHGNYYYEQLFGTEGFSGISSLLYHIHRPTQILRVEEAIDVTPKAAIDKNVEPRLLKGFEAKPVDDFLEAKTDLFFNNDLVVGVAAPKKSMTDYFYKNGHCDELIFVDKGSGTFKSYVGDIKFEPGDYIIIPRGTIYQFEFDSEENRLLYIESFSPIETPKRYRNHYRSEEHTSELQSRGHLVCRLLLEKKK